MRTVIFVCLLFAFATLAPCQEPPATADLPAIDQIIEKAIESAGGKPTLEKVRTRTYQGSFDFPAMGASGTWQRFEKAPNKGITIVEVPNFGQVRNAFDGTSAWEDNPMVGLVEKSGVALARARRDATFHRELALREMYKTLTVKGKEKVGTREAYLVEATAPEGDTEKLYFDAESGLLIRIDGERDGPQGPAMIQTVLEDFRDVEGCKIPFSFRQIGPGFEIDLKITEIKLNTEVDDSVFAKPQPKPPETPKAP